MRCVSMALRHYPHLVTHYNGAHADTLLGRLGARRRPATPCPFIVALFLQLSTIGAYICHSSGAGLGRFSKQLLRSGKARELEANQKETAMKKDNYKNRTSTERTGLRFHLVRRECSVLELPVFNR